MSLLERRHPDFGGLDLQKEVIGEHALVARNIELDTPGQISKRGGLGRVNQHRYNGGISLIADVQRICDYGRVLVVGSLPVPGQPVPFPPSSGDVWEDHGGGVGSGYYEDPIFPPVILNAWAEPGSVRFFVLAYDPQGLPLSYRWNFGGGDISNQQNPVRNYPTGLFSAVVTVTNSRGKSSAIAVANIGPTADLQIVPTEGASPLTVNFDASASDGSDLTFDLDFGDGTPHATTPTGTHTYTTDGIFAASLTVTDKFGATDIATQSVMTDPWIDEGAIGENRYGVVTHNDFVYAADGNTPVKIYRRDSPSTWTLQATGPANTTVTTYEHCLASDDGDLVIAFLSGGAPFGAGACVGRIAAGSITLEKLDGAVSAGSLAKVDGKLYWMTGHAAAKRVYRREADKSWTQIATVENAGTSVMGGTEFDSSIQGVFLNSTLAFGYWDFSSGTPTWVPQVGMPAVAQKAVLNNVIYMGAGASVKSKTTRGSAITSFVPLAGYDTFGSSILADGRIFMCSNNNTFPVGSRLRIVKFDGTTWSDDNHGFANLTNARFAVTSDSIIMCVGAGAATKIYRRPL